MIYAKENIDNFKTDTICNLEKWADKKIGAIVSTHPNMRVASTYVKRGLHNWLARETCKVDRMLADTMLFIADADGNIDTDAVIGDLVEMFKEMEVQQANIGSFRIDYGKGTIAITIPRSPWLDLFFGELGQIRIGIDDILELKELFAANR